MPGAAKTRKEYYININKETTAFKTEESSVNQTAVSGEIQETPSFKPSNEPIRTKKHSELGAISNVLKGAFRGTLSYNETIQDWRPLARLLGNTIDMVRNIKGIIIATAGTITTDENVSGDDGAEGYIEQVTIPYDASVSSMSTGAVTFGATGTAIIVRFTSTTVTLSNIAGELLDDNVTVTITDGGTTFVTNTAIGETVDIIIYQFTKDELLTFVGGAGATANLRKTEGNVMTVDLVSGTIANNDVFTGFDSGARGAVAAAGESQTVPELVPFNLLELIEVETGTIVFVDGLGDNSQSSLIYQHQLSVVREQNSYALNYAYVSLDNQHVMTGCAMKQVGLESAVNEAPKFAVDWLLSTRVTDPTRDAEVLNSLALYEYVDMSSLSIDGDSQDGTSVDWTDILKAFSATFNRSNLVPVDSHTTQAPTGMKGPEVESTLSFEIHEQDATIWNLNLGTTDDDFAVALTFARGISGEDDVVVTYPANRAYEVEEAGEETILLTVPVEVKGTPTVVINDTTPDYST